MPHQTLGPNVSSVAPTTLSILEETGDLVSEPSEISSPIARTKEIVSDSKAYVVSNVFARYICSDTHLNPSNQKTSWSACADDQLGIDSKKGGVLTMVRLVFFSSVGGELIGVYFLFRHSSSFSVRDICDTVIGPKILM